MRYGGWQVTMSTAGDQYRPSVRGQWALVDDKTNGVRRHPESVNELCAVPHRDDAIHSQCACGTSLVDADIVV